MTTSYDFANILFGGPCNRGCDFCIGQQLPRAVQASNLKLFPLRNLDAFVHEVCRTGVRQIVFTGTTTDPQLYQHEARLLEWLRARLPHGCYSLHSNGVLALKKMETFNLYDKVCLSFPSFNAITYRRMMGWGEPPHLAEIVRRSRVEVKVSCLVSEHNFRELDQFLQRCREIGVRRVVLRRLLGEIRQWPVLPGRTPVRCYRGQPVYDLGGLEVTYWNFDAAESRSLNLFADGTLGTSYWLHRTSEFTTGSSSLHPLPSPTGRGA